MERGVNPQLAESPLGRGGEDVFCSHRPVHHVNHFRLGSQPGPEHRHGGKVELNAWGNLEKKGVDISASSLGGCLLGNPGGQSWEGIWIELGHFPNLIHIPSS